VEGRHAPPCLPDTLLSLQGPSLPSIFCKTPSTASAGSYSPAPSLKERKEAVSGELGAIKETCGYVRWFRIQKPDPPTHGIPCIVSRIQDMGRRH